MSWLLRKLDLKYRITKFKLCLIVRLVKSVDRDTANGLAVWDDAQNYMEKLVKGDTGEFYNLHQSFETLAERAKERIQDIREEKRIGRYQPLN